MTRAARAPAHPGSSRQITPSEFVAIGQAMEGRERAQAKERQATGWGDHSGCGNLPQPDQGKTRDKVAAAVGVSGRTYEKAKQVVEAARAEPETFAEQMQAGIP